MEKKVNIVKANGMYMAVPLEVGYNKIVLSYTHPGIKVWNDDFRIGTGCIDFWEKTENTKGNKFENIKEKK